MITQSRIVWLHEQITSSRNNIFVNVCYKSQLQGKQGLLKEPLCDELSEAPLPYHSVVGLKEWQSSFLPPEEEIQKAMRPALAGVDLGNMQTMIWYGCRTADMIYTLKITHYVNLGFIESPFQKLWKCYCGQGLNVTLLTPSHDQKGIWAIEWVFR